MRIARDVQNNPTGLRANPEELRFADPFKNPGSAVPGAGDIDDHAIDQ
jgi:hypothetical protein